MVNFEIKKNYDIHDLEKLIAVLRGPHGCPWDAEQTHESIRRNFIEEVYEAIEAIDERSPDHLCEELGDVLTQVVFHAGIEEDTGNFTFADVVDRVCKKLIFRHPHVFSDTDVENSDEVLVNWDKLKTIEKNQETVTDTMVSVAKNLPAMWRAEKVQKKAAKVGFDWLDVSGAVEKLKEETDELLEAINTVSAKEEIGDILFTVVNIARFLDIDPEEALTGSTDKFIKRFRLVERAAVDLGKFVNNMTLSELEELYVQAKFKLKNEC